MANPETEMTDSEIMQALRDAKPSWMQDGLGLRGPQPDQASNFNLSGPGFSGSGNDWSWTPPPTPAETQTTASEPLPPMELREVTDCDDETGEEVTRKYYVLPLEE